VVARIGGRRRKRGGGGDGRDRGGGADGDWSVDGGGRLELGFGGEVGLGFRGRESPMATRRDLS
jgi:hypothetical protein